MVYSRKGDKLKLIAAFFLPAVFIWFTTLVLPFFYGIFISFTKWDGISAEFTMVGLSNFTKLFSDAKFFQSLWRTAIYTVGVVILSNIVGLALGMLLTSSLKGRNAYRTAIFTPNVIGGIAMGYIWKFIFAYGVTGIARSLGIQALSTSMLSSPTLAMVAMIIVSSWQLAAYLMIIYVSGFTNVPRELEEAAHVDGATSWQVFRNVRLPMIRSSFTVCLFLSIVRSFMVFDINLSLTDGGPFKSTELIAFRIYNTAFVSLKFGNAQAQAVVLFVIVAIISVLQSYFTSRREVQL